MAAQIFLEYVNYILFTVMPLSACETGV